MLRAHWSTCNSVVHSLATDYSRSKEIPQCRIQRAAENITCEPCDYPLDSLVGLELLGNPSLSEMNPS